MLLLETCAAAAAAALAIAAVVVTLEAFEQGCGCELSCGITIS